MNLWLLAFVIVTGGRGTVQLTIEVRHQTVLLGSNVTITCTNVNLIIRTICWYRVENAYQCSNKDQIYSGEKIYPQLRGRYSVVNNSSGRQLTIASAQFNDTGWICCVYCKFPDNGSITQLDVIAFDELHTVSHGSLSAHEAGSSAWLAPEEVITVTATVQPCSRYKIALLGSVGVWIITILFVSILLIQRRCLMRFVSDPHTAVDRVSTNDEGDVATPESYRLQPLQTPSQLYETIVSDMYTKLMPPGGERCRNTESNENGAESQPETAIT